APYVLAQVAGATVAALLVQVITGQTFAPAPGASVTTMSALLVEFLYTFALAYMVLNVAVSKKTQGNSYFGLAIGMTVTVGAFAGGGISGGAFNPAVGIGPTLINATMGSGDWTHLWLYLVGPLAGAAVAATVFAVQEKH
ncbi:MAG: aquaporin, partial [Gemmatimonas sp.]